MGKFGWLASTNPKSVVVPKLGVTTDLGSLKNVVTKTALRSLQTLSAVILIPLLINLYRLGRMDKVSSRHQRRG